MKPFTKDKAVEVFWSKVNKNGPLMAGMETRCWVWTAGRVKEDSYGQFKFEGRVQLAHRVAWNLLHGPIPEGMCVLHECDNPPCVRHLFLGTQGENNEDRDRKGRQVSRRGEEHGRAKLTEKQVEAIRAEHAPRKITPQMLAEKYGVSRTAVRKILSGENWG